jgi:hypothetical protein
MILELNTALPIAFTSVPVESEDKWVPQLVRAPITSWWLLSDQLVW